MKKSFLKGCCVLVLFASFSCHNRHRGNLNITISDHENSFRMSSFYDESKTKNLQRYLDAHLATPYDISHVKTTQNAMLTTDNKTSFYLRSAPGELEINLDRNNNPEEGYRQVKSMCNGIKDALEKN